MRSRASFGYPDAKRDDPDMERILKSFYGMRVCGPMGLITMRRLILSSRLIRLNRPPPVSCSVPHAKPYLIKSLTSSTCGGPQYPFKRA